jgi:hypothetical protein
MVGITLSAEQIRSAPPEVRRWLEQQLALTLGLNALQPPQAQASRPHLVALNVEQTLQVFSLIQGMLPVSNVFFELGREGASVAVRGIEAYALIDILRHTRLQRLDQVVACLDAINDAVKRVLGDANAAFYGLDDRGYCFIAEQTQRSILRLWKHVTGESALDAVMPGQAVPDTGLSLAATSPPAAGSAPGREPDPGKGLRTGFMSPSFLTAAAVPPEAPDALRRSEPDLAGTIRD